MDISMNKAMSEIDNITLNYFINKAQYDNIFKKNEDFTDKQYKSDAKFYKKRILDLTKRLFRTSEEDVVDVQLNKSFTSYIKSCINYLKFLDKSDIIQKKYEDSVNLNTDTDIDTGKNKDKNSMDNILPDNIETECNKYKNCDHLFSKSEQVKKVTLDNYVIKSNEIITPKILPKKEEINIKTKEHKRKGISKKKNIKNIYEDEKNEKK